MNEQSIIVIGENNVVGINVYFLFYVNKSTCQFIFKVKIK